MNTIGIVVVAAFAAMRPAVGPSDEQVPDGRRFRRPILAADRIAAANDNRSSTLRPRLTRSPIPRKNAANMQGRRLRAREEKADYRHRGCCARAAIGHAAAAPPSSVMNLRRIIG